MKKYQNTLLSATLLFGLAAVALLLSNCKSDTTSSNNTDTTTRVKKDTLEFSFVVTGCNRLDKADTNMTTNPSTANLGALTRLFSDLPQLNPKPAYLFFMGDLVLGKTNDASLLTKQLTAWKQFYQQSPMPASGINLVAISGNHEANDGAISNASLETAWLSVMSPYIVGQNGPTANPSGQDGLITDQSRLTYSFDYKDTHFITMNTDAAGRGYQVPTNWINSDIATARANPNIKHIFVIGHKPAYPFDYAVGGSDGLNTYPSLRDSFWTVLQRGKVEAMFAAHNHVPWRGQPTGHTFMVIAGNGGSILNGNASIAQTNYGFTLVQVMTNGKVIVKMLGHNTPSGGYNAPCPAMYYPNTVRDSFDISWKN